MAKGDTTILGAADQVAFLKDTKATTIDGGGSSAGLQTRELDDASGYFYSVSGNVITLDPGTYLVKGKAPAYDALRHKIIFRNTSDSTDDIIGASVYSGSNAVQTDAHFSGKIIIATQKTFIIQHDIQQARALDGLGIATDDGRVETYSEVEIAKVD